VEIWSSRGAQITGNTFRGNLGGPMCLTCRGGGLNLGRSRDVQVTGNQFSDNIAGFMEWLVGANGGGLALDALTDSQVLSNTFTNNSAGVGGAGFNSGGGIYGIALSEVLFAGNTLTGNWASQVGSGHGGGAFVEPSVSAPSEKLTFRNNRFVGNAASLSGAGILMAGGGGLELFLTTDSTVQGNRFEGNRAGYELAGLGGGLLLRASIGELGGDQPAINVVVDGNLFTGNLADIEESAGGGLAGSGVKEYTVINNVFAGNRAAYGGALSMSIQDTTVGPFSATVVNNTLYNNTASGIFLYGANSDPFVISNTIIVSHTVGVSVPGDETHVVVAYTLWDDVEQRTDNPDMVQDTYPVTGPVRFVDPAAGDFRIRLTSAARDAGDPAGVPPAPDHDADGVRRPFGPRVDIGAYEWHGWLRYMPFVLKR
jgi:parallel beta-helix repeat protein